jgi:hypothetical protein
MNWLKQAVTRRKIYKDLAEEMRSLGTPER